MSTGLIVLFNKTPEDLKLYLHSVPDKKLIRFVKMTGEDYTGDSLQGLCTHLINKHKPKIKVFSDVFYIESLVRKKVASSRKIERAVIYLHLLCSQDKYKKEMGCD